MRPQPSEASAPLDDVNWFARPVPNPQRHWIVALRQPQPELPLRPHVRRARPDSRQVGRRRDAGWPLHDRAVALHRDRDGELLRPADAARSPCGRQGRLGCAAGVRAQARGSRRRLLPVGRRRLSSRRAGPRHHRVPHDVFGRASSAAAGLPHRRLPRHPQRRRRGDRRADRTDAALSRDRQGHGDAVHLERRPLRRRARRQQAGHAGHRSSCSRSPAPIPPAARPAARSGSTSASPPAKPTSASTARSSRSTSASTTT